MHRTIAVTLSALVAGSAAAQGPARPDPAVAARPSSAPEYDSAFRSYRPYVDPDVSRWRENNQEMGRLGGHVGHVPGSVPGRLAPAAPAKPAAHNHGAAK